ncbi:MAG: pilus assembly protein PilM [Candidatus Omnitrophica bacterium]|nr:pilus assembly protein PilM [Candidatus Omnitrophota bacterium]
MLNKSNEKICISLSEDVFKIVQLKGGGGAPKISKIYAKELKGVSEADLPKQIHGALKGFNTKGSEIVCIVPPSYVTTKNIEIPSVNQEEIKSIVSLQAGRHTPFSRDEIQIGFINFGVYKTNFTKVLLTIANRDRVKQQINIFEKAGLTIKKVLFAPEGIAKMYAAALNLKDEALPTGIINIGAQSTDFVVTYHGLAISSRNIPVGRMQLSNEGAAAQDKLLDELNKTIESYKAEDIEQVPGNYIITIDEESSRQLQTALREKLSWNVEIISYVDNVKASQGILKQLASNYELYSFADIFSAGSEADEAQINLIPEEVQMQKNIERQGKQVFQAAMSAIIVLVLFASWQASKLYFNTAYLNKLKDGFSSKHEEVVKLQTMSTRTKIIESFLNSRMETLDTINELYKNIPQEIYFTSLTLDEGGNIMIEGISDIASIVYNLGTSLKDSESFKSVDVKSTTSKKDRGKDVSAFEISLKLKSAATDEGQPQDTTEE